MDKKDMPIPKDKIETIVKLLPVVKEIKDEKLRNAVIQVWGKMWSESPCKDLSNAPHAGAQYVEDNLVRHTNAVTRAALAMAKVVEEDYGVPINYDYLIAAGLLHDVDNLILYEKKEGKVQSASLRKWVPHGFYGAYIALEVGVPADIVHAIYAHTPQTRMQPATTEAVILEYCDKGTFLARCAAAGKAFPEWAKKA